MSRSCRYSADHIPIELVRQMFDSLPVKSLLRFKSVCERWCSIISSPKFIARQLRYASCFEEKHRVLIKHCLKTSHGIHISFLPDKKDGIISLLDAPVEPISFFGDVDLRLGGIYPSFFGPCDGVVCVVGFSVPDGGAKQCDLISLWNPATRELKRLPLSTNPPPDLDYHELQCFDIGFGYDFKGQDYKVVKILHYIGGGEIVRTVEVYTLKTDTWRKIDVVAPDSMATGSCSSAYLDGFHYWWVEPNPDPEDEMIVCFDFANDVFSEIDPPDHPGICATITTYENSLALIADDAEETPIKVTALWVFNKDNGINTWTKLFRVVVAVPYDDIVGVFRNGNALLNLDHWRYKLAVYDISSRKVLSRNDFDVIYDAGSLQVVNYVESLVSFKQTDEVDNDGD